MTIIKYKTGRARRTHRRPAIVGYAWRGKVEVEVLDCGHERPVEGLPYSLELDDGLEFETDDDEVSWLAAEPPRRACLECPTR